MKCKRTPQARFAHAPHLEQATNRITLRIQPNEGLAIDFAAKRPGDALRSIAVDSDFSYSARFDGKLPSVYATLLLDVMHGDPTWFTRCDEVEAE